MAFFPSLSPSSALICFRYIYVYIFFPAFYFSILRFFFYSMSFFLHSQNTVCRLFHLIPHSSGCRTTEKGVFSVGTNHPPSRPLGSTSLSFSSSFFCPSTNGRAIAKLRCWNTESDCRVSRVLSYSQFTRRKSRRFSLVSPILSFPLFFFFFFRYIILFQKFTLAILPEHSLPLLRIVCNTRVLTCICA